MTRITTVHKSNLFAADYGALARENDRLMAALATEFAQRQKFYAESGMARNVQERIFPKVRPVIPRLDYYADWRPACGVSSDYIDYFEVNGGNLGLAVGDVTGKGVPPAYLTSSLHSLIRALRFACTSSLKMLVRTIDKLFTEVSPDNSYATLFVGEYNPATGWLHYVNAGHEPPFVLRKSGGHFQTVFLESGGPVIGMLRDSTYREGRVSLQPDDILVAYTDGLCETRNPAGEEWGWPRFLQTVECYADQTARDIVDGVLQSSEAFAEGAPRHDDVTLWVGHVKETVVEEPRRQAECMAVAAAA